MTCLSKFIQGEITQMHIDICILARMCHAFCRVFIASLWNSSINDKSIDLARRVSQWKWWQRVKKQKNNTRPPEQLWHSIEKIVKRGNRYP